MVFISRQEPFQCGHCGEEVKPLAHGSCRNHCPQCLYSKHVDQEGPGDRASQCHELMAPMRIEKKGEEWVIVHRCITCRDERRNKSAPDDDVEVFIRIMKKQGDYLTPSP